MLRAVHLAGHDVTEIAAYPPTEWVQRDDVGAVHLVEAGEVRVEVAGVEPHILHAGDAALLPAGRARVAGQPAMAYLTELRMELARDLLLDSGETAKQVARRTGYKSDAAFNRAFTRVHGRSPGQCRHEHITS
jgi:Helix-turn-helix domain/Cupin